MLIDHFEVSSPNVKYTVDYIESSYNYQDTKLYKNAEKNTWMVEPIEYGFVFRTYRKVPKLGIMLIGWGGNNGSTLTAGSSVGLGEKDFANGRFDFPSLVTEARG